VDKSEVVGGVESFCYLSEKIERARRLEVPLAAEQLAKIRPVDVFHREVQQTAFLAKSESRNNVRMVEALREL
jgi:hypothetical protein